MARRDKEDGMTTNIGRRRGARWKTATAGALAAWALAFSPAFAADKIIVGLITKETTPIHSS